MPISTITGIPTTLIKTNNIPLHIKHLLSHSTTTSQVQVNGKTVTISRGTNNMLALQRRLKKVTAIRDTTIRANSIPQVIGD